MTVSSSLQVRCTFSSIVFNCPPSKIFSNWGKCLNSISSAKISSFPQIAFASSGSQFMRRSAGQRLRLIERNVTQGLNAELRGKLLVLKDRHVRKIDLEQPFDEPADIAIRQDDRPLRRRRQIADLSVDAIEHLLNGCRIHCQVRSCGRLPD